MPARRSNLLLALMSAALVVLFAAVIWWHRNPTQAPISDLTRHTNQSGPHPIRSRPDISAPQRRLHQAAEELKNAHGPEQARRVFAELRVSLQSLPSQVASAVIRDVL